MRHRRTAALALLAAGALLAALPAQAAEPGTAATSSLVDPATPADAQPLSTGTAPAAAAQTLVFSDEFDGTTVSTARWTARDQERSGAAGTDRWWYKPANVRTDGNGALAIDVKQLAEGQYSGGRIDSQGKFDYTYGTIEARVHTPALTNGHLAAVWLQADAGLTPGGAVDGTARDGAEMDITETNYQADKYSVTLHYDGYGADHKSSGTVADAPGLHSTWYHTFGLSWTPTQLQFLYDGTVVRTVTDPQLISQVKEFPILSHEVLDNWADGSVHDETFDWHSTMYVDYVRVWQ
ncbi:glycoside hydrolase family 16 protein [Streptomyces longispororuber]|uniref:glycoside hydrolase family 16 protein n=1 Tax=Streptomyces longispororuber TaxID=68230 RepID=UPI00210DA9F9|nr:glycoside hydrolase family 16 protein [Streptomyces longispororuber]MCQ4210169.1 glycoside hydrolase family 16 protein [Streptomyces longispororuber]